VTVEGSILAIPSEVLARLGPSPTDVSRLGSSRVLEGNGLVLKAGPPDRAGSVMPHWFPEKVDHVEPIGDDEAIQMTGRLALEEGIFAGISTGANVVGAHRLAERLGSSPVIVTLAVDTGGRELELGSRDAPAGARSPAAPPRIRRARDDFPRPPLSRR